MNDGQHCSKSCWARWIKTDANVKAATTLFLLVAAVLRMRMGGLLWNKKINLAALRTLWPSG